jgi:hypothetical protein
VFADADQPNAVAGTVRISRGGGSRLVKVEHHHLLVMVLGADPQRSRLDGHGPEAARVVECPGTAIGRRDVELQRLQIAPGPSAFDGGK